MYIYITYDSDGYLTDLSITNKDGYTQVYANADWSKQLLKYTSKFRYDTNSGHILNPGNLPEASIDDVEKAVDTLSTGMTKVTSSITGVAEVASEGLASASQATSALTELSQQLTGLAATIAEVSNSASSEDTSSTPTVGTVTPTDSSVDVNLS